MVLCKGNSNDEMNASDLRIVIHLLDGYHGYIVDTQPLHREDGFISAIE